MDSRLKKAHELFELGELDAAAAQSQAVLGDATSTAQRAGALLILARVHLHQGEVEAAREVQARLSELDTLGPESWFVGALIHAARGERREALHRLKEAHERHPDHAKIAAA